MEDRTIITITALAFTAITGVLTAIFTYYTSRQKLKEMEFEYERRLIEGYLEKAREYLSSVYIPLSISLSKLNSAFISFRENSDVKAEESRFKEAVKIFVNKIDELGDSGANAFYTTELDEVLQSFREFLLASLNAKETNIKIILKAYTNTLPSIIGLNINQERTLKVKSNKYFKDRSSASLKLFGFAGLTYEVSEVLSASIDSADFEERFIRDIHALNMLVKEVTLGSKARASKLNEHNN